MLNKIFKLRPSIAVTKILKHDKWNISFFKTDIRKNLSLSLSNDITDILFQFNGTNNLQQIIEKNHIKQTDDFCNLINYLNNECVLLEIDANYHKSYDEYHKVYSFLSNYNKKVSELNNVFQKLQRKKVLIVGLGGIGTWIAQSLVMSGIKHLVLVDNDTIDITNLHRQATFFENDVDQQKIDVVERRLKEIDPTIEITKINSILNNTFFEDFKNQLKDIDLIINCADKPSVDVNSLLVGKFGMAHNIPHVIGGGYNLHLSLIAQTVIPYETACVKCFELSLKKLNEMPEENIKKLRRKTRKIGSMLSQSTIAGGIISLEAIKILTGLKNYLATTNIRKEFNFNYSDIVDKIIFERRDDCPWCSDNIESHIHKNLNKEN